MRQFKILTLAFIACLSFTGLTSCSDKENEEPNQVLSILGQWECIESNFDQSASLFSNEDGFEVNECLIFFDGEFTSADEKISGKKCFVVDKDEDLSKYNETYWNKQVEWYDGDLEFEPVYVLSNNSLSIIECDLDRFVGTITVDGDVMTYAYKYQNWNYSTGLMTSESKTYVAKFKKR